MSSPDDAPPTPLAIVTRFFEAMVAQDLEAASRASRAS
jgi:hypothetical protein